MSYEWFLSTFPMRAFCGFNKGSTYERVNGYAATVGLTPSMRPGVGLVAPSAGGYLSYGDVLDITDTTQPFAMAFDLRGGGSIGTAQKRIVQKLTGGSAYPGYEVKYISSQFNLTFGTAANSLSVYAALSTYVPDWESGRITAVLSYDGSLLASGVRIWLNGKAATVVVFSNTLIAADISNADPLIINGSATATRRGPGVMSTFAWINRAITGFEAAKIFENLRTERPARIHPRRKFTATMPLRTQPEELAAGYIYAASGGMANGKWPDLVSGARNAMRVGPIDVAKSGPFCEHIANHGPIAASLTLPAGDTDVFNSNDWTFSCWLMVPAASATVRKIVQLDGTNYYAALDAAEKIVVSSVNGAAAQVTTTSTAALITGKWYHVLVSRQMAGADARTRILLDGTVDTDSTSVGIGVTLPGAGNPSLAAGVMHLDAVRYRKNVVTSDSEARAECLQGGKKVLFDGRICRTGCCPVTPVAAALVGTGLPGSPWDIRAGSARMLEDPPAGGVLGMRRLQAVGTGHVSTVEINAAYGSWYCVWKRPAAQSTGVVFVSNSNVLATSSGWMVRQDTNNRFVLFRMVAGGTVSVFYTAIGYLVADTVYRIWIRRDRLGSIAAYVHGGAFATWTLVDPTGGSGTNPIVDNTYTTSKSMILQLTTNTEYGDVIHYLTAMAPAEAIGLGILEP